MVVRNPRVITVLIIVFAVLGQAKAADATKATENNAPEPAPKGVEIKVESGVVPYGAHYGPPARKRRQYYDYQLPAKVPTRCFLELYGKDFDDAAKRDPSVFQPFMWFMQEYFKGVQERPEFMRDSAQEIRDLFTGISVYNGVVKAPATNVQIARVRADYASPYDQRISLKEHLGRVYNKHFKAEMPLLYIGGQIWPVEAIYCYRHQMPDTSTRVYRPTAAYNPRCRGGFGGRGGYGGRGRGHNGYGTVVRGRTGPHQYAAH
ncbi:hypothetical protein AAVH_33903 [Aphelenchoides avenae]|nr:hypothetical protein AAVH_33903 [Aphelenchus avenae]